MAIGSDNKFPKIIITEGSAPSNADSGDQKLYIDSSDHKLKRKNSSGAVTTVEGGSGGAADIAFLIDGGGSAITTGVKGDLICDFACTINSATLLADQAGAIVVDIFKCTYAQYDAGATHPVSGDKITSATPPTISASNTKSQDTTLSSWTTSISAGDVLRFNVNSAATITRATLILKVTRT